MVEVTAASSNQATLGLAMLSLGVSVDQHHTVLSEAMKVGALEQMMVLIVDKGVTPAELEVDSGAKSMKVGVCDVASCQELCR